MCSCGGELTVWCFDCGDWVCDDCGCASDAHHGDVGEDFAAYDPGQFEYDDDDFHDRQHPVWNEGCDDCVARAEQIEAERRSASLATSSCVSE